MPRVALVMVAVGDLSGSGGAERQFSDLHEYLRQRGSEAVTLVTARASLDRLRMAGRLTSDAGVITLPLGQHAGRGRLGVIRMTIALLRVVWRERFDIVHLCLPTPSYVPFATLLTHLPKRMRPRVVLNVIDCTLAHNLESGEPADLYEQQVLEAHRLYFRWARLDGVYTWYRAFVETCRRRGLVSSNVVLSAARFCFTNPSRFQPAAVKERLVVFAGRFSEQKRPLLFVDAVALLQERYPALTPGWRFEMYGAGVLDAKIRERIEALGLSAILSLHRTPDMAPVFARARLFVSTQALENFTSLAMLEAMAAGNAVIAEDVGQTREFVHHGSNGFLVSSATPDRIAEAIATYISQPQQQDAMAAASRRLATDVHTIDNFAADITAFWREVLARTE